MSQNVEPSSYNDFVISEIKGQISSVERKINKIQGELNLQAIDVQKHEQVRDLIMYWIVVMLVGSFVLFAISMLVALAAMSWT